MTIKYDALGRRAESTDYVCAGQPCGTGYSPVITRHVFDGIQTTQEYTKCPSQSWALAREFVWGDRFPQPVALVAYGGTSGGYGGSGLPSGTSVYHYLHDVLGSVVALTRSDGKVVERYTYDPYGRTVIEQTDPNTGLPVARSDASVFGNPFAWTGQRYDGGVRLYHFLYRSHSPLLGRWLQRDPLGYVEGANLYQYLRGRVLRGVDPLGLCGFWEWALGVCAEADRNREEAARRAEEARKRGRDDIAEAAERDAQEDFSKDGMDEIQTSVALTGFIPVIGIGMDLINAGISASRGDVLGAALDVLASIPGLGDIFGGVPGLGRRMAASICFTGDTPVLTPDGPVPIAQLDVGDRVLTSDDASDSGDAEPRPWDEQPLDERVLMPNPQVVAFHRGLAAARERRTRSAHSDDGGVSGDDDPDAGTTAVDPVSWRLVTLELWRADADGGVLEIRSLWPTTWLEAAEARVGGVVPLSLDELGAAGWATVCSIGPCPSVRPGRGRVVLSTFSHVSRNVLELRLEGSDAPLRVTASHPLYCEEADGWVEAGELRVGDHVRTAGGSARVVGLAALEGWQRVYNIEVESEHCYFAGPLAALAHNAFVSKTPGTASSGHKIDKFGNKLGPSGEPMVHSPQHPTRKRAKDAARDEGQAAPESHPNPTEGDPHFHPTDRSGEKKPCSPHHSYPR